MPIQEMPIQEMIVIDRLSRRFGPFTAVAPISFTVSRGEVLGFLGPNGAGKSTTMKMITGFLAPSEGSVQICGHDIVQQRLAAQAQIGYLPEGAPAYADMTPYSFLRFIAHVRGLKKSAAEDAIGKAVMATELRQVLDQPIDTLSKGFKRRVGFAQAILSDPPVLIMDEPTDGLDPNQKHEVRKLITRMAADKAIIISTHMLEEVDAVCTRALLIHEGRIIADGTPGEFLARSHYHNAVSLTIGGQMTVADATALKNLPGVASMEIQARGAETRLTLFPQFSEKDMASKDNDTTLVDAVSTLARTEGWPVRALYNEAGRLDEVFRALTRVNTAVVNEGAEDAA